MATSEHELQKIAAGESSMYGITALHRVLQRWAGIWGGFGCQFCVLYDTFLHSDSAPWCIRYDSMPCVHNVSWWKHSEALVNL